MISTARFVKSIHHEICPVHWCDIFWLSLSYFHSLKFKSILLITAILRNDGVCCLAIIFGAAILIILHSFRWRNNGRDGVSNHQPHYCLLNRLFRRRLKKTSKLCVTGLCAGNSPVTGEFPARMASNAEDVSIWWRHHVVCSDVCNPLKTGSPSMESTDDYHQMSCW